MGPGLEAYFQGVSLSAKTAVCDLREAVSDYYEVYRSTHREFVLNHPESDPSTDPVVQRRYGEYCYVADLWDELVQFVRVYDDEEAD